MDYRKASEELKNFICDYGVSEYSGLLRRKRAAKEAIEILSQINEQTEFYPFLIHKK